MKPITFLLLFTILLLPGVMAQNPQKPAASPKVEVYYFHPNDRCPIDESIEKNTRTLMQTDFKNEIKSGAIKFEVLNTDDKANAKTVSRFDINAQALYVVKTLNGKETKKDLTTFAFDCSYTNPSKFKTELKAEIEKALK